MISLGLDDNYAVERMQTLILHPEYQGEGYEWRCNEQIVSTQRDLIFCEANAGSYPMQLRIIDEQNPVIFDFKIEVWEEEVAYSPYIAKVYDYCPAPGQFINETPEFEEGDTYDKMLEKVQESIAGTRKSIVSLGAFGGYVTFGFDHSAVNIHGQSDFAIFANAFYAQGNQTGGSAEPGIVMVSIDSNQNGQPDDPWYELAGSDYYKEATRHHYEITYFRPSANHEAQPIEKTAISDAVYIRWQDNCGQSGYLQKNSYHTQDYWPSWCTDSTLTFVGTCLPNNATDISGNGSAFMQKPCAWGYVDNMPNDSLALCSFNLDWAVNENGQSVSLPCCDFIRVYTAMNQICGWQGESSTEISQAQDLHIIK